MIKQRRRSNASVVAPSATLPGTPLLELPAALLDDVARRAIQLGAGKNLSLTCGAFSKTNLLHAPALHIQLDSQGCDQFLTPRVVAALQARTCKLALTLEQQQAQDSGQYLRLLTMLLKKLASCAAVEACKLGNVQGPFLSPRTPLDFSPSVAQCLTDSFPSLTSLSLHGYDIPCSGLAALLSHPRLSVQLQQLDLSSTTITQAERPEPGAATLANLFHASRLKQLSLLNNNMVEDGNNSLLPNLQPLSQHLTQLCIQQQGVMGPWCLSALIAALQPAKLAQLQVLTVSYLWLLGGLPSLLRVLPQLHTLQLPCAIVLGQEELDTLLAATQLTSLQLGSLDGLTSSRADVPCSWQRLELTGCVDCSSAAHLPLHSLTQPLVLAALGIVADTGDDCAVVAAAVHHLTQVCKVPVRIKVLKLCMSDEDSAAQRHAKLQQLVAVLQALKHCCWGRVRLSNMNVGAANVATLAPLCQGCTHLEFFSRNVTPSLEFWRQLVQLMPTVTHVAFKHVRGSASAAMHQSLQLMAEQPWARWLDICILRPSGSDRLPTCWQASPLTQPGKLRVWFKTCA
ncbi:hypothetical protein QJQ45_005466 [Haematococcus lacustris]|nr:hypothetical protein QJQ45_005466 [Haematococcus lacustris]